MKAGCFLIAGEVVFPGSQKLCRRNFFMFKKQQVPASGNIAAAIVLTIAFIDADMV